MKQLLTKDNVASKMAQMHSEGKKITLTSLHASLDNQGSMTTLMRLKSEIELEGKAAAAPDSPEGLIAFRAVWALAFEDGRNQQTAVIKQLEDDQKAIVAEIERLDGALTAKKDIAARLLETGLRVEKDRDAAKAALLDATEQAKQALIKLSTEQAAHADEVRALRHELTSEVGKTHKLELELVRAKAQLGARRDRLVA